MREDRSRAPNYSALRNFAIKTVIIAAAVVVSAWIVLEQLDSVLDARVAQITAAVHDVARFRPKEFWPRLEADIEKAADPSNDLSPERKAKLEAAIRVLVDRWRPVLAALSDDSSSAPAAGQK
jgi:hypothetical protein